MQGRQRLVRRPVGDSPLKSASSGKVFFFGKAGRAGSAQYRITVPPVEKFFFWGSQAGQSARSTASRWRLTP